MKTVDFKIEVMTCEQCAVIINKSLTLGGIEDKTVSYPKAKASGRNIVFLASVS